MTIFFKNQPIYTCGKCYKEESVWGCDEYLWGFDVIKEKDDISEEGTFELNLKGWTARDEAKEIGRNIAAEGSMYRSLGRVEQ